MNNNLNVAIIEYDIAWGDKEANLAIVSDAMAQMPHETDVVVLPEMFSTGFVTENKDGIATSLAERNTQNSIRQLHALAAAHSVAITGSFLANTASQLYNRAFFIEPNGEEVFYDKRHLFRMGSETDIYSCGVTFAPVVRFRGWDIKIIVCYDLRFPAWCRNRFDKNRSYDLLVTVANWPKVRHHTWNTLLMARAMENLSYVCGANRCGVDLQGIDYASGSSALYDFKGQPCAVKTTRLEKGCILSYTLDYSALKHFREKFPVWKDFDNFELKL